jgi:hypothetical protein
LDGDHVDAILDLDVNVDEDQPSPRSKDEPEASPVSGQRGPELRESLE